MAKQTPNDNGRKTDGTFAAGNKAGGRTKGSRNKTTLAVQSLLEGEAEAIGRKAIELAKAGDMTAIRLVLERIVPPRKDAPVQLEIPAMQSAHDAAIVQGAVVQAVGRGEVTPSEGHAVCTMLEQYRRTLETVELEQRISRLEERNGN